MTSLSAINYITERSFGDIMVLASHPPRPFAPGGYEIARVDDFDIPEHHLMLGNVKNRQPVLFHSHPGQCVRLDGVNTLLYINSKNIQPISLKLFM